MADVPGKFYRATKVRTGVSPSSPGAIEGEVTPPLNPPGGGLNSVGLTMPSAFTVSNSPLTANGTIGVTGAGTVGQYIRGDGSLASFPSLTGFVPYTGATQNVDLGEYGVDTGFVNLDTTPTNTPTTQGTIYWDDSRSTAALIMNGTLQHIGQDTFFYVKNSTGSSIPKGTCVRFSGTDGASGHLLITPFLADGSVPSSYFMGVTSETIANGAFGQVMHFGELDGINTSGFTAGALLYASTTVAGGFQTTAPIAPNNIVLVAAAINSKNNGAIIVRPQIGSNINNDEGVKIVSPTTGQLLQLQSNGLWENKTKAQVLGGTSSQFVKGDGSLDSTTYQSTADKGQPNGYASLDGNGKVPLTQINDALIGNVNFQGLWNAATNTPTLANPPASGTKGYYYIVSTGGTFAGISFEVGDWIISNGSAWGKVDNTDAVSSVFGRTGNVVAANGDYTTAQVTESGNLYYTDARSRAALSFSAGSGAYNTSTGVITIPTDNNQIANSAGYITSAALSGYVPTSRTITINGTTQDLSANRTFNVGTVTSVTASSPIFSSGGSTPNITIQQASGSQNGFLSSTDWTTFNNKQNALTNPVTGTGSAGQVAYWSSGSAITGESNLFWDATNNRLGINNSIPEASLDLGNTGGQKFYAYNGGSGNRNGLGLDLGGNAYELSVFFAYGASDNGRITFGSLNGSTYSTKMTILGNGNVNIIGNLTANSFIKSGGTSSQYLMADGSVSTLSNPVTGTGTTNTVPKFTGTSSIGDSQIIDNGTSVGIGVSPTTNKLEVGGGITIGTGTTLNTDIRINNATNGKIQYIFSDSSTGELGLESGTSVGIKFNTNGPNTRLIITSDGTLGFNGSSNVGNAGLDKMSMGYFNGNYGWIQTWSGTRLLLNPSGNNVVIGSTSDNGARLQVSGTSSFSGNITASSNAFFGTFNGNNKYHFEPFTNLAGGANNAYLVSGRADNNERSGFILQARNSNGEEYNAFIIEGYSSTATNSALHINNTGAATFSSSVTMAYGGNPRLTLQDTDAGSGNVGILFKEGTNDRWALASVGGAFQFFNETTSSNAIFITSGNNVGIGTPSPNQRLEVNGRIRVSSNGSNGGDMAVDDGGIAFSTQGSTPIAFWRDNYTNQSMRIFAGGNVFIGPSPSDNGARLQVAGNVFVNDDQTTGNGVQLRNADRPLITRGWDAFTSGNKTGVGRWGVYMEAAELFLGSPGTDYSGGLVTIGGWLINGTRQPNLTVNNQTRRVGIGTTTPSGKLSLGSDTGRKLFVYDDGGGANDIGGGMGTDLGGFAAETSIFFGNYGGSGRLSIGAWTSSQTYSTKLTIFANGNVTIVGNVTAPAFFESSDSRIKTLIENKLDYQAIANVTAKYYEKNGKIELGYFAQDFESLLPSAVSKNEDGLLNLSYREVHTAKIAYLEERIKQLEKKYEIN